MRFTLSLFLPHITFFTFPHHQRFKFSLYLTHLNFSPHMRFPLSLFLPISLSLLFLITIYFFSLIRGSPEQKGDRKSCNGRRKSGRRYLDVDCLLAQNVRLPRTKCEDCLAKKLRFPRTKCEIASHKM